MMMENIIHFDFVDSCYKDAISSLMAISRNDKYSFLYLVILAIYDCFDFNKDKLQCHLKAMHAYKSEGETWLVDPYELLKGIYSILSGEPLNNENLSIAIEAFKTGKNIPAKSTDALPGYKEMLSFILLRTYNTFHGSLSEAMRLLNAMITYYPKMMLSESVASAYLFSMMSFIRASSCLNQESLISKLRIKIFHIQSIGNSTPYIQSVYLAAKAYESKNEKDYAAAVMYAEKCIEVFKRNHLALHEILMYNLLICLYTETDNGEKKNEYVHRKLHLLDQKKVHAAVFHKIT